MSIIHRHLLQTFLRYLAYTLAGSLLLFIVLDLLGNSTSLIDNEATASMVVRFYLYKSAFIVDTVMPIAMLMATLFTVGTLARYLELSALFSAGWSLMKVVRPLVILAILVSIGSLAWREYVLPEANLRRYRVWEVEIHKNPDRIKPTTDISLTGPDGRLYHADKFDPQHRHPDGIEGGQHHRSPGRRTDRRRPGGVGRPELDIGGRR
jgi:lipopolysaccharide export system permease protein